MLGRRALGLHAAQVDDAFHARVGRRRDESLGSDVLTLVEPLPFGHCVHEVVDDLDVFERRLESVAVVQIEAHPFSMRIQSFQATRRAAHRMAGGDEDRMQMATDEPRGTGEQHPSRHQRFLRSRFAAYRSMIQAWSGACVCR